MGRSKTPKYRIKMFDGKDIHYMAWEGKANAKSLEEWIMAYAKSLEIGGCNEHISKNLGYIPYPVWAEIQDNVPESRLPARHAQWKAGIFQVW